MKSIESFNSEINKSSGWSTLTSGSKKKNKPGTRSVTSSTPKWPKYKNEKNLNFNKMASVLEKAFTKSKMLRRIAMNVPASKKKIPKIIRKSIVKSPSAAKVAVLISKLKEKLK